MKLELRCQLSLESLQCLASGGEVTLEAKYPDHDITMALTCSPDAVSAMRDEIEQAMLRLLPVGDTRH